jgi:DNA ligase 1
MELISIVHELRLAKGSKNKVKILEQHKNNELWKKFLKYTYDPFISYGVSAPKDCTFDLLSIDDTMFDLLDMLVTRRATGNSAKEIALSLSTSFGEIPRLVLGRSLKAGVSITTINKVYPDLIETWESMKGKDVPIKEFPVMTSIKYDGVKVFVKVQEIGITLYSSSGLEFKLKSLSDEFSTAMLGVYEGELTHREGKIVHRPVITGHLNSLLAGTKADIPNYKYRIYDWIALDEWDSRQSKTQWWIRQKLLKSQFETGFQDSANVRLVAQHFHDTLKEVVDMFEELISTGYEGTMSRYANDVYAFSRELIVLLKKSQLENV